MSTPEIELKEPIIWHKRLNVPYKHSVGLTGGKFFKALGEKKILGIRCPDCAVVYVPPHSVCPKCIAHLDDWVELGDKGTLSNHTVIRYSSAAQPQEAPFAVGMIKLDGADTEIVHMLGEVDLENIKDGIEVTPVFKESPEGNILDIKYFKPL